MDNESPPNRGDRSFTLSVYLIKILIDGGFQTFNHTISHDPIYTSKLPIDSITTNARTKVKIYPVSILTIVFPTTLRTIHFIR